MKLCAVTAAVCTVVLLVPAPLPAQPPADPRTIEAQEGWVRLFDGQSLYGWNAEQGSVWRAEGGMVKADSGPGGWLRSEAPFSDFLFHLEFRTHSSTAHSAVYFHAARQGNPAATGFEIPLQDDGATYLTGSITGIRAAPRLLTAAGGWKSLDVIVRGADITVSINGNRTASLKSIRSKLGYFGLLYKPGSPVEFRDIRVKPIDFSCLTNGRDLDGFRAVKPVFDSATLTNWVVRDGSIYGVGGPGQLETEQAWDDFILQVDVRALRGATGVEPQGAIFFRGIRNGWHTGYSVLLRNELPPDEGLSKTTGALAGLAPAKRLAGASGTWQTVTVMAVGRDIATWVNGDLVSAYHDARPASPNNPAGTARLLRGTTGILIDGATSSYSLRNYCVKRMNR